MQGIFGTPNKIAAPLSYTPVSGFALRSMRGLGALGASTIPGTCWDATGFKDCHAKAFAQAQSECAGGMADRDYGGDLDTCVERNADAYAWAGCVQQICPQSTAPTASGATTIKWRNATPNATVKKLQAALNKYLAQLGANTMTVDGILGSGTCGAAFWVDGAAGTSFYTDYGLASICKATTMPTKKGTKTPVQTIAVVPQTTVTPGGVTTEKFALPWETFDADTQAVQGRINTQLDAADMNPINTGGKLDAPTCGAMKWMKDTQGIDLLSVQGVECQGFTAPTKKLKAGVPVTVPPPSSVLPTPSSTGPLTSQASMATTGIVALAAIGGLWWAGKHYKWF